MVSVDDTALAVTDTGGSGRVIVYLNGGYASQTTWRRVIADLGDGYRHITYDERARGKSKRSADYSFEGAVRDITAVLAARGVERAILAGWSYGALLSWYWAERNPDRTDGLVTVDAAPSGLTGPEGEARIRKLFHRMRFVLPLASLFGLAGRMSAAQHAEVGIDANRYAAAAVPLLEQLTCPVRFVLATGNSLGSEDGEMEKTRASLAPVLAHNPNVKVSAKVASNHSTIMRKDWRAVAEAIREVAAVRGHAVS
ncbi:alpha/beta hydrolase [Nocardia panacis]|uniref:Alpha/beta hydrolase n=2 Tax=Nocardia panacis TaxID=2340916 RepID=A0A3A4K5N0_9NOCA|nr:alpha/beta hydrolase [Nocardia panacis]